MPRPSKFYLNSPKTKVEKLWLKGVLHKAIFPQSVMQQMIKRALQVGEYKLQAATYLAMLQKV